MSKNNYASWSTKDLENKRKDLVESVEQWKRTLKVVKSTLIMLSLSAYIDRTEKKIHKIDTELAYRCIK